MAEIKCPKCGEHFEAATTCPSCGAPVQGRQRLAALQAEIRVAEAELERLSAKRGPFARAKTGALKSKISTLKIQIENLQEQD